MFMDDAQQWYARAIDPGADQTGRRYCAPVLSSAIELVTGRKPLSDMSNSNMKPSLVRQGKGYPAHGDAIWLYAYLKHRGWHTSLIECRALCHYAAMVHVRERGPPKMHSAQRTLDKQFWPLEGRHDDTDTTEAD